MTIEEKLKKVIQLRFGSLRKFSKACGIPASTLSTIFKRGLLNTTTDKLVDICDTLELSTDDLVRGRIIFKKNIEEEQNSFLDKFNLLSERSKGLIDLIMDYEINTRNFEEEPLIAASGAENLTDEELKHNMELGEYYYNLAHKNKKE